MEMIIMYEKGIFDIEASNYNDLISKTKISLRKKNFQYKKLLDEVEKIMDTYPNLQLILEDDKEIELTKKECKMLQKLYLLDLDIRNLEEQSVFFLGGKEAYFYFKNIGILKE